MLGLYGGDDGINLGQPEPYKQTCEELGIDVKLEMVPQTHYVKFLGRIYTDPLYSGDSMIDFWRCVGKLHITCSNEKDDKVVARRKALSLKWSDPSTPFLGAWADAILRTTANLGSKAMKRVKSDDKEDRSWWYHAACVNKELASNFPQPSRERMIEVILSDLPDVTTKADLDRLDRWLADAETYEGCFYVWDDNSPIFGSVEAEVTVPVAMNGEVIGTPKKAPINNKKFVETAPHQCLHEGCKTSCGEHYFCAKHAPAHMCTATDTKTGKRCRSLRSQYNEQFCRAHCGFPKKS